MRVVLGFAILIGAVVDVPGVTHITRANSEEAFERSLAYLDYSSVDYTPLLAEFGWLSDGCSQAEILRRMERNLPFILHQRLDRRRFLVAPEPQRVVERIGQLFALGRDLDQLYFLGLELRGNPEDSRWNSLVAEVEEKAKEFERCFRGYFLHDRSGNWLISLPRSRHRRVIVNSYLAQFDRIRAALRDGLRDYFLPESPGLIEVSGYEKSSLTTLSEALRLLSEGVRQRLLQAE